LSSTYITRTRPGLVSSQVKELKHERIASLHYTKVDVQFTHPWFSTLTADDEMTMIDDDADDWWWCWWWWWLMIDDDGDWWWWWWMWWWLMMMVMIDDDDEMMMVVMMMMRWWLMMMQQSGLSAVIGQSLGIFKSLPDPLIVLILVIIGTIFTTFTSNVSTTTILLPITAELVSPPAIIINFFYTLGI